MDMNGIFLNSLDANPVNRRAAEKELRKRSKDGDTLFQCLNLITDDRVEASVKKSSLIYMKNNFIELWSRTADQSLFKQRIIESMLKSSDESLLSLFCELLGLLIGAEYSNWGSLLPTVLQLVQSNNPSDMYVGLLCLIELLRFHHLNNHRDQVADIASTAFPRLFVIASSLIEQSEPMAGYIIWKILKVYKKTISIDLFSFLQQKSEVEKWSGLFLRLIMKRNNDMTDSFAWTKTRKWSMVIINTLFFNYTVHYDRHITHRVYSEFSALFISVVLPEFSRHYLRMVNLLSVGDLKLSDREKRSLIGYFILCVPVDGLWEIMYPQLEVILSSLIFGSLRLTEQDLDDFENSPQEFILNQSTNIDYDSFTSSHNAALFLLEELIGRRRNVVFSGILYFVNNIMQKHRSNPSDIQLSLDKDCGLYIMCDISDVIMNKESTIATQMQDFINAYVIPDFNMWCHGFLRARLCQFLSLYCKALSSNESLTQIYNFVFECIIDDEAEMPTKVFGSYALLKLLDFDYVKQSLSFSVTQVVQKLLPVNDHVDPDLLSHMMQELVATFPDQLLPYSYQLCHQLCSQFLRLASEMANCREDSSDMDPISSMQGILGTLITILLTMDEYPDEILRMEQDFLPIFKTIITHPEIECQGEMFEIIDICVLTVKKVSPSMWSVFELFHDAFMEEPSMYMEDLLPCLNNFVYYGMDKFCSTPEYIDTLFNIINYVLCGDNDLGYYEEFGKTSVMNACLILFTCCPPGSLDHIIPSILKTCYNELLSDVSPTVISTPLKQYYLDLIVGAIYYNPEQVISFSTTHGTFNAFMEKWLSTIERGFLRNYYDKKLSISALLKLVRTVPQVGSLSWFRKLGLCLATLLQEIKQGDTSSSTEAPSQQQFTFIDESSCYINMSQEEEEVASFAMAEESMQLMPLTETTLDHIDVLRLYSNVMNWLKVMDQANYDRYETVLTNRQRQIHCSLTSS